MGRTWLMVDVAVATVCTSTEYSDRFSDMRGGVVFCICAFGAPRKESGVSREHVMWVTCVYDEPRKG